MHGRAGAGPPAPASLGAGKIVCNRPDDGKDRIKGGENPKAVMKDLKTNYYFVHFRNSEHLLSAMNLPIGSPFATPTNQRLISYSQTDQNTDDGEQENLENEKRIHNERLRLTTLTNNNLPIQLVPPYQITTRKQSFYLLPKLSAGRQSWQPIGCVYFVFGGGSWCKVHSVAAL